MSAPPSTLNPTLADLLSPSPDPLFLIPTLLIAAAYAWGYVRAHREGRGQDWPAWKAALFTLGVLLLLITTQSRAATLTQSSMALYMTRLMVLAEVVPPLPRARPAPPAPRPPARPRAGPQPPARPLGRPGPLDRRHRLLERPHGFNASIVSNTAASLLPGLYLLSSLLVWSVILRPSPPCNPPTSAHAAGSASSPPSP